MVLMAEELANVGKKNQLDLAKRHWLAKILATK